MATVTIIINVNGTTRTLSIADAKLINFQQGFLKAYPNKDSVSNAEHLKNFIREQFLNYYKAGRLQIVRETIDPEIDDEVVEEV